MVKTWTAGLEPPPFAVTHIATQDIRETQHKRVVDPFTDFNLDGLTLKQEHTPWQDSC